MHHRPRDPNTRFRDDGTDRQFNFTGDSPTEPSANDNKDSGGAGGKDDTGSGFGSRIVALGSVVLVLTSLVRSCNMMNGDYPTFTSILLSNGTGLLIILTGFALINKKK